MKNIITKIEIQKRNSERVNIFVNNEFLFACSSELVYIHNLVKGKAIDLEEIGKIVEEDNYIKGKSRALKYLERGYKTEKEVFDKLQSFEYDEKTIARIMMFLIEYGFVNDENYAKMYTNTKVINCGKSRIKQELLRKGIKEEYIYNAFDALSYGIEEERAKFLCEKRFKVLLKSEGNKIKLQKKLYDFLIRKGYDFDVVSRIVNEILEENSSMFCRELEEEKEDKNEILEVASKRYEIIKRSEDNKQKIYKKLHDFLLRRGYSYEEIKSALREIMN